MSPHSLSVRESEPPLSSFQRLDGGLVIHTDDHSVFGRVQVESHDVRRFLGKLWIGAHAPTPTALKVDAPLAEKTPDIGRRHVTERFGYQLARPRGVPIGWRLIQLSQDAPLGRLVVHPGLAGSRRVVQPLQSVLGKARAPLAHGSGASVQQRCDIFGRLSRRGLQHDTARCTNRCCILGPRTQPISSVVRS